MYCIIDLTRYSATVIVERNIFIGVILQGIRIDHHGEAFLTLKLQDGADFSDVLACKKLKLTGGGVLGDPIVLNFISESDKFVATIRCSPDSAAVEAIATGEWHFQSD